MTGVCRSGDGEGGGRGLYTLSNPLGGSGQSIEWQSQPVKLITDPPGWREAIMIDDVAVLRFTL